MASFPCRIYLEWTKASLRTDLPQNTREKLLLEVATTYKIKTVVREKFNIFIFIFPLCGMKQMKQTVKHSVVIEKGEVLETFASNCSNFVRHYFRNM